MKRFLIKLFGFNVLEVIIDRLIPDDLLDIRRKERAEFFRKMNEGMAEEEEDIYPPTEEIIHEH